MPALLVTVRSDPLTLRRLVVRDPDDDCPRCADEVPKTRHLGTLTSKDADQVWANAGTQ